MSDGCPECAYSRQKYAELHAAVSSTLAWIDRQVQDGGARRQRFIFDLASRLRSALGG